MLVLTIETSTPTECVAIVSDGSVIASVSHVVGRGRAASMMNSIDAALGEAGLTTRDMDVVAVSIGPGRFSGLRVGLATAKGLAASTGIPVRGVSTLEALAASAGPFDGVACAMLDARKGEVYTAVFGAAPSLVRLSEDAALPPAAAARAALQLAEGADVLFVGTGAEAYGDVISNEAGRRARFSDTSAPTPEALAALALSGSDADLDSLEPVYLRGI